MAAITGAPARARRRLLAIDYKWQVLIVAVVGAFMVMLDATVVNIALPRIITVFGSSIDKSQFVLTGYMLSLAVVMPAAGYLTDTFGSKRIYVLAMGLFIVGSALCGLAWDINSLTLFRVLQGIGGGTLMPLGITVIYKAVPPEERGTIMGLFGVPLLLGPLLGPTLGGYIVEYIDWRVIFTLNIPVGGLGLLLGLVLLQETEIIPGLRFDVPGFIFSAAGFGPVLYALSRGPSEGWAAPQIMACLFIGLSSLAIWVLIELDTDNPLLELRVLTDRTYGLATGITFITTLALFSSMFLLPLFLQNLRGLGALESGLLTFPQALASGLMLPIAGRLFDRIGPRPLILTGLLIVAYATWQLGAINLTTGDNDLRMLLIIRGAGMGLITMPAMTAAMNSVPPHLVARASSLTNVLRQLFASFGTAIFATLLQTRQSFHQAMLAQTVTADSLPTHGIVVGAQQLLLQHGVSLAQAKSLVLLWLQQEVAMGAAVRSFDDAFLVAAVLMLLGILPALFLSSRGLRGTPGSGSMLMG